MGSQIASHLAEQPGRVSVCVCRIDILYNKVSYTFSTSETGFKVRSSTL